MKKFERDTAIYTAYEDYEHELAHGEASLLRAILSTALSDLEKDGLEGRRAREYFLSDEDDYLFSFSSICGYLNIDPDRILECIGLSRS